MWVSVSGALEHCPEQNDESSQRSNLCFAQLRTLVGHSGSVMSLDFHPKGGDLICSSDGKNEIRYWSINKGGCARVLQVQAGDRLYLYGLQNFLCQDC